MQKTSKLDSVRTAETRGGNTRYIVRDEEGNEYTTFRPQIGERAKELEGRRVRITYRLFTSCQRTPATSRSCSAARPAMSSTSSSGASGAPATEGSPIVKRLENWFAGRVIERLRFGDHWGFLLEPIEGAAGRGEVPLTFHRAKRIEPGHEP